MGPWTSISINLPLLISITNQVQNPITITAFVIVPSNQLEKSVRQHHTGFSVESGASGVAVEVGGDDRVFGVG